MVAMIEFGSISPANHRLFGRCRPVLLQSRPLKRRFGPLRASEGFDSCLSEINQPLEVVAGDHRRQCKARARLSDCADQLAAHLFDARKHVLDSGTRLGDAMVTPLLTLGKGLVAAPLSLYVIVIAVLLCPGRIRVFLAPFGRFPISRHPAFPDQLVLLSAVALIGARAHCDISSKSSAPLSNAHTATVSSSLNLCRVCCALRQSSSPSKTSSMSASFPMSIGRPRRQEAKQNKGL